MNLREQGFHGGQGASDESALRLVPTTYPHNGEGCGERIPSPHAACQQAHEPYLAGERLRRFGVVLVVCNGCRMTWREVAAGPVEGTAA